MKKLIWLTRTLAALSVLAIVSTAFAADPGVNSRQRVQRKRINQGVRSGELTRNEAKSVRQEEKALREEERAYKSDGKLTAAERKDLHQDLNQTSKNIHQQKHDSQARPRALHPRERTPVVNAREHTQ